MFPNATGINVGAKVAPIRNASPIDIVRSTSPSFAPCFVRAYLVLGYFPHPPSASNIAPENQVCKGGNKDVIITTLFSEFTKIN